jgi:acetolactate synthase-1/2/3 large subunit
MAARAPVILAGGGARHAATEVRQLAETLGAPVVMTINGRGILPPDHPLNVSITPSVPHVRRMIEASDLVIAIGTELGRTDYDLFGAGAPSLPNLIRVDLDADGLAHDPRPTTALRADAATAVGALLTQLEHAPARYALAVERANAVRTVAFGPSAPPLFMRRLRFLEAIRDQLPDAIFVGDSTQPVYVGNIGFSASKPGSWFNSATGFGTLGYALPAAAGASLGAPTRPIVCLIGDGGIQFSLGELGVLREVDAWIAIVIWNNRGYAEIDEVMKDADIEPVGVDLAPPNFALLAAAYGYEHRAITDRLTLERALQDFAARRQVMVLDIDGPAFDRA